MKSHSVKVFSGNKVLSDAHFDHMCTYACKYLVFIVWLGLFLLLSVPGLTLSALSLISHHLCYLQPRALNQGGIICSTGHA